MLRTPCSLAVIVLCALPFLAGAQICPKLEGGLPVVGSSPALRACPTQITNLDVDGDSGIFSGVCQIERRGDYAYLLSDDSIYVLDVSAPPAPVVIERVVPPGGHWCFDMQLVGDRLYIAEGREGLAVWDVSAPASPVLAGSVGADQYVSAVAVRGTTAYLSGFGLRIFDVSDLADPMKLGELESTSPSGAVAVTGDLVLLSGTRGVQIVDVTDPAAPVERSVILAGVDDYAFAGTLAYMVGSGGLATYDLSDPTSPVLVGSYDLVSLARAVLVDGDVAYVGSSYPNRLDVLSIADPAAPQLIGSADVGGWDLELVDGLLYDPFGDGLKVFDVDSCFETESSLWVPIAAHVDGLWGSRWRTDLVLFNEGEERADVQLVLHADDGQHQLDGAVEAGSQGVFEDVVGLMEAATKGLLEVRSETLLRGVSRTFEAAEAGTYGQFLGASYAEEGLAYGERGWLLHLRQESGRFRTNIAVANTWHAVAKLAVDLFASDGTLLATYPLEVPPTSVVHDLEPFVVRAGRADLGWGFARVRVTAGKGVLVLASVVDDRTNDATTVPLLR